MSGKENEAYRLEKERKVQASRKFEEITSLELLNKNCIDKQKGCGIAFLPALTIVYLSIMDGLKEKWVLWTCGSFSAYEEIIDC